MGNFVISLDFELYWGVRAKKTIAGYRENLLGVRKLMPQMLDLFDEYGVKATFATVGFLFCKNEEEWLNNFPELLPTYNDAKQSPYTDEAIEEVHRDKQGLYHFAPGLIEEIRDRGHEIGTHTYSHYFCQEPGQTPSQFREDLERAKFIAEREGIEISSIVFPRNQYSDVYLNICREEGIFIYRGNQRAFYYKAMADEDDTMLNRVCRLVDTYINLSGHNCVRDDEMKEGEFTNVPASMFIRPYSKKLSFLEPLRLRRIKNSMTYAAKNNLTYHIWWHPHNFGANITENLKVLEEILKHFEFLRKRFNFKCRCMKEFKIRSKIKD